MEKSFNHNISFCSSNISEFSHVDIRVTLCYEKSYRLFLNDLKNELPISVGYCLRTVSQARCFFLLLLLDVALVRRQA